MIKLQPKYPRSLLYSASILSLVTFIVFFGATQNQFVDLDDLGYIVDNRHLDSFNWKTIVWAFTDFHEANWHPLTMLSLAIDRQIWGESPFGFHLINIVIHSGTVFVSCYIFYTLIRMVDDRTQVSDNYNIILIAALVSAFLFGIHPLRVESVVWASERKDVLCLFFIVNTIWWHLRFTRHVLSQSQSRYYLHYSYWMVILMSSLALMSKPAAVSLPLLLLIIDYYPIGRISDRAALLQVLIEKVPLLIITVAATILTIIAQQYAMIMAPQVNFVSRLLVAVKALFYYLWKMFLPNDLAPYYPHPGNVLSVSLVQYLIFIAAFIIVAVATITSFKHRHKIWAVIAVYYIITLLPMLGIIQVGGQWVADRYTYLPSLGISLFWGGGLVLIATRFWYCGRLAVAVLIGFILVSQLVVYTLMTYNQVGVWRNNETLATREIELFPHTSGAAYYSRAKYRKEHGECEKALLDIDEALSIALRNNLSKKYADISFSRAEVFLCLHRRADAIAAVDWAIQTSSDEERDGYIDFRRKME